ncbi:MAG: hypothetical protein E6G14_06345 [Actinobacteria bacterium]|nr:MAG: hypothetical protein E6G14_06345 [Actinomycetota bacterium]
MARGGTKKEPAARRPLPAPLPPETRTVGQLVAETIRVYQRSPFRSLAIGVLPGLAGILAAELNGWDRYLAAVVGAPVFTLSYVCAVGIVTGARVRDRAAARAFAAGVLTYIPFPFLALLFLLPGLAWFALLGLVVPVAQVEGLSLRDSFARAQRLGRADFLHAFGGLCALTITVVLSQGVVFYLLRGFADNAAPTAASLAGIAFSPLLFLGAVVLYGDQVARVGSQGRRSRRRDADLPDADHAHREGRSDAQVEPGPAS